jgi:hypothetical protein
MKEKYDSDGLSCNIKNYKTEVISSIAHPTVSTTAPTLELIQDGTWPNSAPKI